MTNLIMRPIAQMQNSTPGGAQFYGADRRLYGVRADPGTLKRLAKVKPEELATA